MKKKFNKKGFQKKSFKKSESADSVAEPVLIENLNSSSFKKKVALSGMIDRIIQTGGPTIFEIRDGTGTLALKGFIAPGERAYPELNEGDYINATIKLEEFNGEIEGDIVKIKKAENEEEIKNTLQKREREKAKVQPIDFLVKNKVLDKLKDRMIVAATEIRLAIFQNRPIIVRHHNDTDGYCAGFALERAILPLIEKQHSSEKAAWEFFTRAPSAAPYYEIDDSIRDTAQSLKNVAKFSNKMPLILIVDNGSGEEDLMEIQQGKIHGADFIVVDHHGFEKDVISAEDLTHINPFLVEESGAEICAGMLCAELARFINPDVANVKQIAAMSGYADRIDLAAPGTMKKYLKVAEEDGYAKELLGDISLVIDYVSAKVRFMEVREYIEVLFGEPRDKQKELVELMAPHIRKLDSKGLAIGVSNAKQEKIGKIILQSMDIEDTFPGFGFFPKPGRATGLVHDDYQKQSGEKAVVTAGIMRTAITFRATDAANFSVHELKKYIEKKCPEAFIEGGGHKNAGALSFLPYKKDEVVKLVKEFIKK